MKKIYLLVVLMTTSMGFSQSLPFTFDESADPTYYFTCFDCNFVLTTDPDDAGNAVGQLTGFPNQDYDTAQTLNLAQNIDLSDDNNNTITFRFRPVNGTGSGSHLLKFEGGAPVVELPFSSTGTGWQTITLDFGPGLGNYSNMIIFPDFANPSADTYLIDDIAGGLNVTPPPPPSAEFPIDFSTVDDTFICYDCAFSIVDDAGNPVGSVTGGGLPYDTAQLNLGTLLDLSDDANNTITFRIKPVNGTGSGSHLLKFEGGTGPITELPFTTTGTDWQNISLNYPAGLGTYSLVVLFTDFNNASSDTYLIDDFAGGTNVSPPAMPEGPAPTPSTPDASVFRLYGDTGTYSSNMAYDYTFGTLGGEFDLDDTAAVNKALQFNFNVAGWGAGQNISTNVSTKQFVHFDYWATNATDFKLFLISKTGSAAAVETTYEIGTAEPIVLETWTSVTIPIANFTGQGFDVNNYLQYKFDVTSIRPGIVYIDNLYFSDVPPTALSVNEVETLGFKIYPNPAQDEWNIQGKSIMSSIVLYDVLGKQILSLTPNALNSSIDASGISKGIYFAKISSNGGNNTFKLIKN